MKSALSFLFAVALLGGRPTIAGAADAPSALPFVPPTNWQALPAAFLPHPVTNWNDGLSAFTITTVAAPLPADSLETVIRGQSATLGTVRSSASTPICGHPAAELVVTLRSAPQILTEQVQLIDDTTYVLSYNRPSNATAGDPSIAATLANFCGKSSIATLAPPPGWTVSDAQLLGIWVGSTPTQIVTLLSSKPQSDAKTLAQNAVKTAFKGADVAIVSNTTGLLCGLPATFFTAKVTPNGLPSATVTLETTEGPTVAYTLLYSHPASAQTDDAATSSLKTLCANQS